MNNLNLITGSIFLILVFLSASCGFTKTSESKYDVGIKVELYHPEEEDSYLLINVRSGPDAVFPVMRQIKPGTTFTAIARDGQTGWLKLAEGGWISGSIGRGIVVGGDIKTLPIIDNTLEMELRTFDTGREAVVQYFNTLEDKGLFNGCVLFEKDGEIIINRAFGYADFANKVALDSNSLFDIGSITKTFTAMGIMILKERGEISYEDKLSLFFPEFPSYADDITIRHLLTHTSGIRDYINEISLFNRQLLTHESVLNILRSQESLHCQPGEKYAYSNSGYWLLGAIIEKVSKTTYSDFLRKNILTPLNMSNTYVIDELDASNSKLTTGFRFEDFMEQRVGDDSYYYTGGDGGIFSCSEDLYKWLRSFVNPKLIAQSTLNKALNVNSKDRIPGSHRGFSWNIGKRGDHLWVSHGGYTQFFISWIGFVPDKEIRLVLLSNNASPSTIDKIIDNIDDIYTSRSFREPVGLLSNKLFKMIVDDGPEGLKDSYRQLKKNESDGYHISVSMFLHVARNFFLAGKTNEAFAVLNLAENEFPESSEVYYYIGLAYSRTGDKEKARLALEKALQLDPDNKDTRQELNEESEPGQFVTDIDSNIYHTVHIGDQVWMAENLRVRRLNDSSEIPLIISNDQWTGIDSVACSIYDNDEDHCEKYGVLYNWYTVNTGKLCPAGWHVPSDEEWNDLEEYAVNHAIHTDSKYRPANSGTILKSKAGWHYGGNGTDDFGFKALPGGERLKDGRFLLRAQNGFWWSSTGTDKKQAIYRSMLYHVNHVYRDKHPKSAGFSVRCMRNE